jgi:hypothetical protein
MCTDEFSSDAYETVFSHASHLRLFLTRQNFLGIGSESLFANDSVWIIAGARVPLILREASQGVFHIVGGAYLHGFMNGEALELNHSWSDITIV